MSRGRVVFNSERWWILSLGHSNQLSHGLRLWIGGFDFKDTFLEKIFSDLMHSWRLSYNVQYSSSSPNPICFEIATVRMWILFCLSFLDAYPGLVIQANVTFIILLQISPWPVKFRGDPLTGVIWWPQPTTIGWRRRAQSTTRAISYNLGRFVRLID